MNAFARIIQMYINVPLYAISLQSNLDDTWRISIGSSSDIAQHLGSTRSDHVGLGWWYLLQCLYNADGLWQAVPVSEWPMKDGVISATNVTRRTHLLIVEFSSITRLGFCFPTLNRISSLSSNFCQWFIFFKDDLTADRLSGQSAGASRLLSRH